MDFIYSLINMMAEMSPYLLLGFFVAGLLYAFVPQSFYKNHLAKPNFASVVKAAIIGVPLPLCSCGVLPTAVSLHKNGASAGATTSFLIATPQTGIDSISATYSLLTPAFAIIRPIAALITAIVGGVAMNYDDRHSGCHKSCQVDTIDAPQGGSFGRRMLNALHYGFVEMAQNIGKWLLIGLLIAAAITVFVPDGFFTTFASYPFLSMIAVVIVAVPMYICSTGSIPIALSLMIKGLTPGAAFVLLMAGPAANFASIVIVSKALGRRTAIVYLSTIIIGAISFGLCIDYLLPQQWFAMSAATSHIACHISITPLQLISTVVFVALMAYAFIKKYQSSKNQNIMEKNQTFVVKGMTCGHCKAMVEKNIGKLPGVEGIEVDLATGNVNIKGHADENAVREVVEDLGFALVD